MSAPPDAAPPAVHDPGPVPAAYREPSAAARIVIVLNQKGGLGKTTVVMALAAQAGQAGHRTLVVDVDPQASAYTLTQQIPESERPYTVALEHDPTVLAQLRDLGRFDRIYVDCPGSLEDHGVLSQVLAVADYALIPYDHKAASQKPTFRTVAYTADAGVPYRVLLNRISNRVGPGPILAIWDLLDQADYWVDWPSGWVRYVADGETEPIEGTTRTSRVTRIESCRLFLREYVGWSQLQEVGALPTTFRRGHALSEDLLRVYREVERDMLDLAGR
jgi:AAA domain